MPIFGFIKPNIGRLREKRDIENLSRALQFRDANVRRDAASAMGEIGGKEVISPLIQALEDDSHEVRVSAIEALTNIGNPAVEFLIQAMTDGGVKVRSMVAQALRRIGEPSIEPLLQALRDENWEIRDRAIDILGHFGLRVIEPLLHSLKDRNYEVRQKAINFLSQIGEPSVQPLLIAMKDNHECANKCVIDSLARIDSDTAIDALIQILNSSFLDAQKAVVDALVASRKPRSIGAVVRLLKDPNEKLREWAAKSLQGIEWSAQGDTEQAWLFYIRGAWDKFGTLDSSAVEPLIGPLSRALNDVNEEKRLKAARALRNIGNMEAINAIAIAFSNMNKNGNISRKFLEEFMASLPLMTIERSLPALIEALNYAPDSYVRTSAARALGELRDVRAVEGLISALTDASREVGEVAAAALEKIGDEDGMAYAKIWNASSPKILLRHRAERIGPNEYSTSIETNGKILAEEMIERMTMLNPNEARNFAEAQDIIIRIGSKSEALKGLWECIENDLKAISLQCFARTEIVAEYPGQYNSNMTSIGFYWDAGGGATCLPHLICRLSDGNYAFIRHKCK